MSFAEIPDVPLNPSSIVHFFLQIAKQYPIDESLKEIVKQSPDGKINYGIIRGTVKPIGQPIQSVMSPSVTGVLQVIKLRFVYSDERFEMRW